MARDEQHKAGWRERRKQAKRRKAERSGDTPEKQHERPSENPPDLRETVDRAATTGGMVSGGFGGS